MRQLNHCRWLNPKNKTDPPASGLCQTVLAPQHNKVFPHIPETTSDPVLSPLPRKVTQKIIPDNIYDGGHVRSWVTEQEHESTVWETVALTTCLFLFFCSSSQIFFTPGYLIAQPRKFNEPLTIIPMPEEQPAARRRWVLRRTYLGQADLVVQGIVRGLALP